MPRPLTFPDSTAREIERISKTCGPPIDLKEYRRRVEAVGYRLETDRARSCAMGAYANTLNDVPYDAFGVTYTDPKTGAGYANIAADRTNLPALQALRFESLVVHNGRIVET